MGEFIKSATKKSLLAFTKKGELTPRFWARFFEAFVTKDELQDYAADGSVDHGLLSGLTHDDHTQYYNSARHSALTHSFVEHGNLTGLADDDHAQYLLASSAGSRALFASNWTDLTDTGNTTLHIHDSRYYTETELDAGQLDNRYYTETETDAKYLPLTAGSGKPLTGDLYISKTSGANLFIYPEGVSTDKLVLNVSDLTGLGGPLFASFDATVDSGDVETTIEPRPLDGSSDATVSLFTNTSTTGTRELVVYLGDGTTTKQHSFNAGTGVVGLCQQAGTTTIGSTASNGILLDPVNGIYLYGSAIAWDDCRGPASALAPGANAPSWGTFQGGLNTWIFSASLDQDVEVTFQLPHGYAEGTDIELHVHWAPMTTNTGDVVWEYEYSAAAVNGTFPSPTSSTVIDAADGTQYKHQLTELVTISGSGLGISSQVLVRIARLGSNGSDTFTGTVALLEIDLHYQKNSLGSDDEFVKGP